MKRIFILSIALLTLSLPLSAARKTAGDASVAASALKYAKVCRIITDQYMESVTPDSLTETALKKLVSSLDPHSSYLTESEVEYSREILYDGFEGIGVRFNMKNDTLVVISPLPGGPAAKAGILKGDRILMADTTHISGTGMSNDDLKNVIRGPKGTKVSLTLLRDSVLLNYDVVRDHVDATGVSLSYMITDKIGFIGIDGFTVNVGSEFEKALLSLKKQGAESFIIDLRGNAGGLLTGANQILSMLLPKGTLIYTTKGEHRPVTNVKTEKASHSFLTEKLVVLIDGGTASASEVVAGALQDNGRAVIAGSRSFGKGLIQQPFALGDGSEVRLTIARFYTPNGRCIQKPYKDGKYLSDVSDEGGIHPDVTIDDIEEAEAEAVKILEDGK